MPDAWAHLTNWGNSVFLMPAALAIATGLCIDARAALALRWSLAFACGVLLTLATKVAFLGWGIGIAALDFTGVSGHSMLAASVMPMLAWWLAEGRSRAARRATIAAAVVLALVIGISRLVLEVHSISEVVSGLAVGFVAVAWTLARAEPRSGRAVPRWIVAAALGLAFAQPLGDTVDRPHGLVTRIALVLSGHAEPYTRDAL